MALVCDIKSTVEGEGATKTEEVDLEDGEIKDDDDDASAVPQEPQKPEEPMKPPSEKNIEKERSERNDRPKERDRSERRRHDEKGKKHMTEAEKSILHLRKREEMQRKKWEKFQRVKEVDPLDDDFAKNIEKTLATILNKKEKEAAALASGGEDKEKNKDDDKRGRKRRKNDKEYKRKQKRLDSPNVEFDENETLNVRGGSADREREEASPSIASECSGGESEYSSDANRVEERVRRRETRKDRRKKDKDHDREKNKGAKKELQPLKDSQRVCIYYLQGKCTKNDCPHSHEAVPPMKLELCKFYLMDRCAKGLSCAQGDNCKFAHGKPLSEGLKQILFKHIETAPRDILGGFPRMSRDDALNMINVTQNKLHGHDGEEVKEEAKGGIPSLFDINVPVPPELLQAMDEGKNQRSGEKPGRNRPSRWQDPDPNFPIKSFNYGKDQDMRVNSNGDIDMRTLPPPLQVAVDNTEIDLEKYKREAGILGTVQDLDIRPRNILNFPVDQDVDIRQPQPLLSNKDTDIRQIVGAFKGQQSEDSRQRSAVEEEPKMDVAASLPADLPKMQRELFLRIQAQQKENTVQSDAGGDYEMDENINWYSDDDDEDDNRLTIKVDNDDVKEKEEPMETGENNDFLLSPPQIKPQEVVEKLGDLSKIDISAEVTKLLTSMSQNRGQFISVKDSSDAPSSSTEMPSLSSTNATITRPEKPETPRPDPRLTSGDPRQLSSRQSSTEKLSIYEQGSIDRNSEMADIDLRSMRSDVDLRNLQLPFKGMQNYTPASEIDASINSHPPMAWKISTVEIPKPDYTGLKLSVSDAEKTGDPRLRKIFRLSTEERDTPLSPKASPKAGTSTRVDPRLRKIEETKNDPVVGLMNFNQQLNILQSSAFYQSLTSNQKLLLNQELNQRNDSSNSHDPVLNSLLSNLNIIPGANIQTNPNLGAALSILANVTKLNPGNLLGQAPGLSLGQPGLLGAAPGIPNLPPDFPINFDPRNGGLLGNAPMNFNNFQSGPEGSSFNFNDDFYQPENGGNFQGRGGGSNRDSHRGFNRERRRGRHFNRGGGNRNFRHNRNNRSNRTHSPP